MEALHCICMQTVLVRWCGHQCRRLGAQVGVRSLRRTPVGTLILPKYNVIKYQSPASVATAIDDMADAIVTKATQKAKEAIENAACDNSQTKQQSALE